MNCWPIFIFCSKSSVAFMKREKPIAHIHMVFNSYMKSQEYSRKYSGFLPNMIWYVHFLSSEDTKHTEVWWWDRWMLFFFGCSVQWLDVGSHFPDWGLNPSRSGESVESQPLDRQGAPSLPFLMNSLTPHHCLCGNLTITGWPRTLISAPTALILSLTAPITLASLPPQCPGNYCSSCFEGSSKTVRE